NVKKNKEEVSGKNNNLLKLILAFSNFIPTASFKYNENTYTNDNLLKIFSNETFNFHNDEFSRKITVNSVGNFFKTINLPNQNKTIVGKTITDKENNFIIGRKTHNGILII